MVTPDKSVCQAPLVSQVCLEILVRLVMQVSLDLEATMDHKVIQV